MDKNLIFETTTTLKGMIVKEENFIEKLNFYESLGYDLSEQLNIAKKFLKNVKSVYKDLKKIENED